ncbi:DUF3173 family protein [Lacticaseibacillus pantheris]|uniref:DUF3173 family protein n=1 Tax=Lacticaseibacillus pantheris TaxID=171523 RepID=UPI00265B2C01|nr:DUF3173 family protein [Lacticaseibacillus pantheris]WKF85123.1 DUF3173 family protein [Lacticaseibacillus pantheris]
MPDRLQNITKKDLMVLGYGEYHSKQIIRMAKVSLVQQGYKFYDSTRVGRVPTKTVEDILGYELSWSPANLPGTTRHSVPYSSANQGNGD